MDFINLMSVLKTIATCVQDEGKDDACFSGIFIQQAYTRTQINMFYGLAAEFWPPDHAISGGHCPREKMGEMEYKFSQAAYLLNRALRQTNPMDRPTWVEFDRGNRFPVIDENGEIEKEGFEILNAANSLSDHHWLPGIDPKQPYRKDRGDPFFRPVDIGFDRKEIITFLESNGIPHTLGNDEQMTWREIANYYQEISEKTAQNWNNATGGKYIKTPGKGGKGSHCLTTHAKLDKMFDEVKKIKYQHKKKEK